MAGDGIVIAIISILIVLSQVFILYVIIRYGFQIVRLYSHILRAVFRFLRKYLSDPVYAESIRTWLGSLFRSQNEEKKEEIKKIL